MVVETTANLGANTTTYATYTINQTTGALTSAGSVTETGFSIAGQWAPSGDFFWITSIDPSTYAGSILTFSVSGSGAISLVGSAVSLPDSTNDVYFTVTPNGDNLFVLSTNICNGGNHYLGPAELQDFWFRCVDSERQHYLSDETVVRVLWKSHQQCPAGVSDQGHQQFPAALCDQFKQWLADGGRLSRSH